MVFIFLQVTSKRKTIRRTTLFFQFQNLLSFNSLQEFTSARVFLHELSVIHFLDSLCRRRDWFPVVQLRRKLSRRSWLQRRTRSGNVENRLGFLRSCQLLPLYRFHGPILEISVPCCYLIPLKFNTSRYWTELLCLPFSAVLFAFSLSCFSFYWEFFGWRSWRLIC